MQSIDPHLIRALDVLLTEGSVTAAARRLHLSPSAMSRTLTRIRHAFNDPILVRAGRGLVSTPRAEQLRPRVRALIEQYDALLRAEPVRAEQLARNFRIRAGEAVPATFGAKLRERIQSTAPNVSITFVPEGEEQVDDFREGRIDLDIGAMGDAGPEIKQQTLFRERMMGVVRKGHPLLKGKMDARRFASYEHISASRRGRALGPLDTALAALSIQRKVSMVVPNAVSALFIVAGSDMVAIMGQSLAKHALALGMSVEIFALPVKTKTVVISQAWHPRVDADPAHRWLREQVRAVFR